MISEQQLRDAQRRDDEAERRRERDRQALRAQMQAGTHREEDVELWAHCSNVLTCSDEQIPVVGVRTTTSRTYADNGADDGTPASRLIETSWSDLDFLHDEDRTCKRCAGPMHLSEEERPIYAPLSGHDQRGLVEIAKKLIVAGVKPTPEAIFQASKPPEDDRVSQLEHELADLKALVRSGHSESPVDHPAAASESAAGVKGYRKRGAGRYEALLYRSETADARQRSIGTFATPEEAVAAREAALSEETTR